MFNFYFHYHQSDDNRLLVFILVQLRCIIDFRDLAYKFRFSH